KKVGDTWLLFGNQRLAQLLLQQLTWKGQGYQNSNGAFINAGLDAPRGALNIGSGSGCYAASPQTVTGGGNIWAPGPCTQGAGPTAMLLYEGTISGDGSVPQDQFAFVSNALTSLLNAGTVFTFVVTPVNGSAVNYSVPLNVGTNESIAITSPTSGSL